MGNTMITTIENGYIITWRGITLGSSLHARETEVCLPSTHSPPPSLCLHQLRNHSEGREAKIFSSEVGTLNIRPVDSKHCKWLQTRANRESQAVKAALPTSFESQSACPSRARDCQHLRRESHSECSSPQETLSQQLFHFGEERERATPGDKPAHTKFTCAPPSFQDGGLEGDCRRSSSSTLYVLRTKNVSVLLQQTFLPTGTMLS